MQYSLLQQQDELLSKDKENLDLNMERSRRMQAETAKRRKYGFFVYNLYLN